MNAKNRLLIIYMMVMCYFKRIDNEYFIYNNDVLIIKVKKQFNYESQ